MVVIEERRQTLTRINSQKLYGRRSSKIPMSFENRFNIFPNSTNIIKLSTRELVAGLTNWIIIKEEHFGVKQSLKHVTVENSGGIYTYEAEQNGTTEAEDSGCKYCCCIHCNSRTVPFSTSRIAIRFHDAEAVGPTKRIKLKYANA